MARTPKDSEKKPVKAEKPAKARPGAEVAEKPVLTEVEPAPEVKAMKLKDLIDAVAQSTGGRKPEVKATVEATLSALGKALTAGQAVAVPPLGKLRVVKTKGAALTLKLRLADPSKAAGLALADDGEDG